MPLCESHRTAEVGENEKPRGFTAGLLECGVKVALGSIPGLFMKHISLSCAFIRVPGECWLKQQLGWAACA